MPATSTKTPMTIPTIAPVVSPPPSPPPPPPTKIKINNRSCTAHNTYCNAPVPKLN